MLFIIPCRFYYFQFRGIKKAGIRDFRMDFTMESAKETKAILKLYEEFADGSRRQYPKEWENRYTNGHYKRGVE